MTDTNRTVAITPRQTHSKHMTTNEQTTQTPNIASLTPAQLAALRSQLTALRKAKTGDPAKRNAILDKMLIERDGDGFKHTTADMLAALQAANVVASVLTAEERAAQLKQIQTRKQKLAKKNPTISYGYKASATGIGALTLERVLTWLADASAEDRKAIAASVKSR